MTEERQKPRLMRTPKSIDLSITTRCNLRCKYCSHFTSASDVSSDLPKEEWIKFIEEMGRCAVLEVTLEGGEIFVREDLKEIIEAIIKNRMRFSVLSNGTLITKEWAKYLKECGRCSSVQVSIDGSIPATHDSFRGKGTFYKAVEGLKNLMEAGVNSTVRVTIHRKNVHDLENVAKLLLEDIGLPGFSTNSASHMGTCRSNSDQVQLTPEERSLAMVTLLKLNRKYGGRIGAMAGPLSEAKFFTKMVQSLRENKPPLSGGGYLTSCGGPNSKLAVRPDGVIVLCLQMCHIELGHINKDSLQDIWQNHPEAWKLRGRRQIPLTNFEFCKGCEYMPYCRGGCPALAYTWTNEVYGPSPDACLRKFLQDGGTLPDESLINEKEACGC